MDFTLSIYIHLLNTLKNAQRQFITFARAAEKQMPESSVILRHDVDKLPGNALKFAKIQHDLGIQGSYFFRSVPQSFDENIINQARQMKITILKISKMSSMISFFLK